MSSTLADVRTKVRFHLRDRNKSDQRFSSFEVDAAVVSVLPDVAHRLRMAFEWLTGALSISNATDTYNLPGSQAYSQVLGFRSQSQALDVEVIPREDFDGMREGVTNPQANGTGFPTHATVWEDATGQAKVQLYPWPKDADTLDMKRSLLPAAQTSDSSVIPFDAAGVEALALETAAYLAAKSAPEVLATLQLAPDCAAVFKGEASSLIADSRVRRARHSGAIRQNMNVRKW